MNDNIPKRYYTVRTNENWDVTYTITGDYSSKVFYCDVTNGDGIKLFSTTITKTYSVVTGLTTIIVSMTETQIETYLTVGTQYFANLKYNETKKTWVKLVFNVEIGQTST